MYFRRLVSTLSRSSDSVEQYRSNTARCVSTCRRDIPGMDTTSVSTSLSQTSGACFKKRLKESVMFTTSSIESGRHQNLLHVSSICCARVKALHRQRNVRSLRIHSSRREWTQQTLLRRLPLCMRCTLLLVTRRR